MVFAVLVIIFSDRQCTDWKLLPVIDIFKLKDRIGEALAFSAIFLGESNAKVANARVGEVLTAT